MKVSVPATTANMGPGFDCLGMALSLYNTVEFEQLPQLGQCVLSASGEGVDEVELDEHNLIYKVYKRTLEYKNAPIYGIKMHFDNQIPFARGLGSSSAAIVSGAVIANYFLQNSLTPQELLNICLEFEGHPDNLAPALLGGVVISGFDDEGKIFFQKITPPNNMVCLAIVPDYQLSTTKARNVLPKAVAMSDAVYNISRTALLVDALHRGDLEQIALAMRDKLHQPYRQSLIEGMDDIRETAALLGAKATVISGSGPTLLALFDHEVDGEAIVQLMAERKVAVRLLSLRPEKKGAVVE